MLFGRIYEEYFDPSMSAQRFCNSFTLTAAPNQPLFYLKWGRKPFILEKLHIRQSFEKSN